MSVIISITHKNSAKSRGSLCSLVFLDTITIECTRGGVDASAQRMRPKKKKKKKKDETHKGAKELLQPALTPTHTTIVLFYHGLSDQAWIPSDRANTQPEDPSAAVPIFTVNAIAAQ